MRFGRLKYTHDYSPGSWASRERNVGLEAEDAAIYKNRGGIPKMSDFDGVATVPFSAKDQFKDILGKGNYKWDEVQKVWRVKVKSVDREAHTMLTRLGVKFK